MKKNKDETKDTDKIRIPKIPRSEMSGGKIPPALQETTEKLLADAKNLQTDTTDSNNGNAGVSDAPRKRGRPKGSTNKAKGTEFPPVPVEALAHLHRGLWEWISTSLNSQYKLTDTGAKEMGEWASLCIKQYVGPLVGEHVPLAMYCLTQLTALMVCITLRKPKEKSNEKRTSPQEGPTASIG